VQDLDDGELARRIAGAGPGEAGPAETALAARFAPRIRLYGLRHLRDRDAAEDLVQDVLVITLEALRGGAVEQPERVASFVLGTCRMTVANRRRAEVRRASLLGRYAEELAPATTAGPGPVLDRERLADCLGRLPARARTVVALTFYAERTAPEIARELGTSPGNVRVLRHRALATLHDCLDARTP
jgi:RNA polymerase sigma-70 factor (ECF subfamily)